MDPNTQLPPPAANGLLPQGSDWQRQAIAAAQAAAAQSPNTIPVLPTAQSPVIVNPPEESATPAAGQLPPPGTPTGMTASLPPVTQPTAPPVVPQSPMVGLPGSVGSAAVVTLPPDLGATTRRGSVAKKLFLVFMVLILLAAVAAGAYFLFLKPKDEKKAINRAAQNSQTSNNNQPQAPKPTELSSLAVASFVTPESITKGYTERPITGDYKSYTSPDAKCQVDIGKTTPKVQPGKDVGEILEPQIKAFKDQGATITGPSSADALVLHDTTDTSKLYSMPTLYTELQMKDSKGVMNYAAGYYSISIMPNQDRMLIIRSCLVTDSLANAKALLYGIETEIKKVTVSPTTP